MHLSAFLQQRLEPSGVSVDEFQHLLVRLLNYGVLVRAASNTERELYDRCVRVEELAREALDLFALTLHHDRRFEYMRVYPPGSRTPDLNHADDRAFGGSLRARLTQHEVALVLVLRAQYDKALREGKIDEAGYASEPFEAVSLAMKNWLNRTLPEKAGERRRAFQRLRQLRLIEFRDEDDVDRSEAWLRIHPMIVDFVGNEAIEALQASGAASARTPVEEADDVP